MSKATPGKGAASKTAAAGGKGGGRTAKLVKGHFVTEGNTVRAGGKDYGPGSEITKGMLEGKRDPDGSVTLQRLVDGGELAEGEQEDRAGGGLLEAGGATGAGPSTAQITAAQTGNDAGATAVVDAALSGSKAEFTAAAEADSSTPTDADAAKE